MANPVSHKDTLNARLPLRLGTRASPLAMAQAHEARGRLCAAHGWPEAMVTICPLVASGDRILDRPLAEIGGKALWTKELDVQLGEGRIDFAVHSMKDVETIRPPEVTIAAILPRADIRDRLLGAASLAAIPRGGRVGTSAPRRAAQLLHLRPDLTIAMLRGNVATRMAKLAAGEMDATLLAAAGLERLGLSDGVSLDFPEWLPAPAQGAIGIECRAEDEALLVALAAINDAPSYVGVMAERALLEGLGGSCRSAVATHSLIEGDAITLTAAIFSADGSERVSGSVNFAAGDHSAATALATSLLERASPALTSDFNPPS